MGEINLTHKEIRINTKNDSFDMQEIQNRRFMFNPKTGSMIIGRQYFSEGIESSHAEEHGRLSKEEPYDDFIRGWVGGAGSQYKSGVIHFAPPIEKNNIEMYNKSFSTLEIFAKNGALTETIIRGFPVEWEQPLKNIINKEKLNEYREERYMSENNTMMELGTKVIYSPEAALLPLNESKDLIDETVYFNSDKKPFNLAYVYASNGVTVFNRLDKSGEYDMKEIAHINPDYTIDFYEDNLPLSVIIAIDEKSTQPSPFFNLQEVETVTFDDNIFPDPSIAYSEMNLYGYKADEVLPLLKDRALELFDADHTIYMLYTDNTEAMVFERNEIINHDGIFGIDVADWIASREYAEMVKNNESKIESLEQTKHELEKTLIQPDIEKNTSDTNIKKDNKKTSRGIKKPSILGQIDINKTEIAKREADKKVFSTSKKDEQVV